jgi:hypothetical protein
VNFAARSHIYINKTVFHPECIIFCTGAMICAMAIHFLIVCFWPERQRESFDFVLQRAGGGTSEIRAGGFARTARRLLQNF